MVRLAPIRPAVVRLPSARPGIALSLASLLLVAAAFLLSTASTTAYAAWPHDPNVNVPVCTAAQYQFDPRLAPDGAGGAFMAWYDSRSGQYDIYAQRVNAAGVPLWTTNGIGLCTATNNQAYVQVIPDGAGGAIFTWQDWRNFNWDIYAQRVNAAGVPQWGVNGVALCSQGGDQYSPILASDGAGGAIVAWQDFRTGTNYDIYARRVNAAGTPQWTADGVALCTATNHQQNPTIISDGAGGAIVAWSDYRTGFGDIYGQRVNATGIPQWTADGVAVCSNAGNQFNPLMVSDGAGGGIVAFSDDRNGSVDVYAARVGPTGAALWFSTGMAVCTASNDQQRVAIAADGAGGAIVGWDDYRSGTNFDLYAQRVAPGGAVSWAFNGVAVSTAAGAQQSPTVVSDGAGGAIIAWNDGRDGVSYDIYAQGVSAAGNTQWTNNGVAVSVAAQAQTNPAALADVSGGAIVAWIDSRSGADTDIYAQRIEHFGYLGNPEPTIASVRDVPNDQGGKVKVSWYPSWLDGVSDYNLAAYDIYRSAPGSVPEAGAVRPASLGEASPAVGRAFEVEPGAGRWASPLSSDLYAWELVGSVTAVHFLPAYSFIAPTTGDSVGGSNPRTIFIVVGRNYGGYMYWLSAPDSGYSVDNIPPSAPSPFVGAYFAGATHLHWGANSEADLAGYRLYRGSSSGFVPGPSNLVSAQPDTGFGDPGPAGSWYKLSAVDSHGNESVFAILGPDGTTDAPGAGAFALSFSPPAPNPVRGEGASFRIALPAEARVALTLFDQQGRRVRDLERGTLPGGEHYARWDGRDQAGNAAPSGIYFARLEAMGRTINVRFLLVR